MTAKAWRSLTRNAAHTVWGSCDDDVGVLARSLIRKVNCRRNNCRVTLWRTSRSSCRRVIWLLYTCIRVRIGDGPHCRRSARKLGGSSRVNTKGALRDFQAKPVLAGMAPSGLTFISQSSDNMRQYARKLPSSLKFIYSIFRYRITSKALSLDYITENQNTWLHKEPFTSNRNKTICVGLELTEGWDFFSRFLWYIQDTQ